jgi:hypothetical protein
MKRNFVIFSIFLMAFALNVLAQRPHHARLQQNRKSPEERASLMTQRMTKRLKLNGEQSSKIGLINKETNIQIAAIRKEAKEKREKGEQIDMKNYRERVRNLNQAREEQTLALLNAKQKEEYRIMKEDAKNKMKKRMHKYSKRKGKHDRGFQDLHDEYFDDEDL